MALSTRTSQNNIRREKLIDLNNLLASMNKYEKDELNEEETTQFFQLLLDTGLAWELQGHYGRITNALLQNGNIKERNG